MEFLWAVRAWPPHWSQDCCLSDIFHVLLGSVTVTLGSAEVSMSPLGPGSWCAGAPLGESTNGGRKSIPPQQYYYFMWCLVRVAFIVFSGPICSARCYMLLDILFNFLRESEQYLP